MLDSVETRRRPVDTETTDVGEKACAALTRVDLCSALLCKNTKNK